MLVKCTCGKEFKVSDEWAGKRAKCKACGGAIQIPAMEPPETAARIQPVVPRPSPPRPPAMPSVPLESGHVAYAPSINVHTPKRSSSLGIVSLIIGVLAFMFCWIPILGIISIPLSALGLLLAAIGLVVAMMRRGAGVGWPIGGGVICGLALLIGFSQIAVIGATTEAITEANNQAAANVKSTVIKQEKSTTTKQESGGGSLQDRFDKIQVGMMEAEMLKIMGNDYKIVSDAQSQIPGIKIQSKTYQWGGLLGMVHIVTQNGKVFQKVKM